MSSNPKLDIGIVKQGFQNIPASAIVELAKAMNDGAKKYGSKNWRDSKVIMTIYLDAIFRHYLELTDGHDIADDSKISHLGHIMANCAIMIDALRLGVLDDDRSTGGDVNVMLKEIHDKNKPLKKDNFTPLHESYYSDDFILVNDEKVYVTRNDK